jgi:acetyltransferase-like isoleucine patch superfamily enzyme
MIFFSFLRHFIADLAKLLVIYLPGESGVLLRRTYYSRRFRSCGRDLWIGTNVQITNPSMIVAGDDVRIRENVIIHTGRGNAKERRDVIELTPASLHEKGLVILGNHSRIAFGAVILGYGGVKIGKKCGVGPGAIILSETFHYKGSNKDQIYKYSQGALPEEQCVVQGLVELKDGSGVASNVIILPGATVGKNSWITPGSIMRVRGRVDNDVIAKGDPAVTIFKRPYVDESSTDS